MSKPRTERSAGRTEAPAGTATTGGRAATTEAPSVALLPFAPLLWAAWADGALSADEIAALRQRADRSSLDEATRTELGRWLDPADPPQPAALSRLREAARSAAGEESAATIADLGTLIARSTGAGRTQLARTRRTLRDLQSALGPVTGEATRAFAPEAVSPAASPATLEDEAVMGGVAAVAVDPAARALRLLLQGDHADLRGRLLELLSTPEFAYVDPHDHAAYRARVLSWCRRLASEGFGALALPREFGGEHDAVRQLVAFETLAFHDSSLLVKFGVQFGLFGGSIFLLGTRHHHETWLQDAGSLALPGCFAMTETAHGSNVRDIGTTATYIEATDEFEIHTPSAGATKDYIGNAALHGRMAVVFAQLHTRGEHHGVHAFMVPIRDAAGRVLDNVTIEDCGSKAGLNGVDNGRIRFHRVRVPRPNLLNRFGDVAADGTYTSPITSAGRRFFTMLGTLVAGRIAIAAGGLSVSKSGLTIAVRYTDRRRQFGPEGKPEVPVLDYLTQQRALLPRLAEAYALHFALHDLMRRFGTRHDQDAQEIEALAAGLKAWSSRHAVATLQACREACAGQGYLEANRLGILRADVDVFTTFEGANLVLLQLVARALLTGYREQFGELRLWTAVRWVSGRAATRIAELNPIITRRTDPSHLRDGAFHLAAFRWRETRLLDSLARRLRRRIQEGEDSFVALNACQDHAVMLADAYIERVILERMLEAMEREGREAARSLQPVAALFALAALERDAAWYLEKGYIEAGKAAAIRDQVNALCRELRPHARMLVDGFGIPDPLLAAPIATRQPPR